MRRGARTALALLASIFGLEVGVARADEPSAPAPDPSTPARSSCDAAFEAAELGLRPSDGHLLEARAALRACALPSCQPWMVDDCTKRLVEVEARIPSVVFSADDGRGGALYDVRVLEGDRELAARLDGRAVEMDPGPHALVAEHDGTRVPLSFVALEGKKAQQAAFVFPKSTGAGPAFPVEPRRDVDAGTAPLAHPWAPPLSGGLLVAAVIATGLGIGFGLDASAKKDEARCDASNLCDGPLDDARTSARTATVAFVVSGALAVGSVVTYLVFGRARGPAQARLSPFHGTVTW